MLRAWRPRGVMAEAGPLSNTPREERADPTLTLPREARKKTRNISHRLRFSDRLPIANA